MRTLLLLSIVLLLLGGTVLLVEAGRRRAKWERRVQAVTGGVRPAQPPSSASDGLLRGLLARLPLMRAAAFLGMRADRISGYRPRWFVILGIAFVIGRIAGGVASDTVSDALLLPATAVGFVAASRALFSVLDGRRREALFRQFPDALAQITRAVRVGIPVVEAIRQVASEAPEPTGTEFRAAADRLALGVPLDEALADTAMRTGVPEYRFFATALSLQARTGGGLADTLDNLAEVIRKRVALKARGRALASEARTSAGILAFLPFFTCGLLFIVNPSYVGILLTTPDGKMALGIAAAMLTTGMLTMRFIIRKALS